METSELLQQAQELVTAFGVKVIAAIAILVIGRWIAKALASFVRKLMNKAKVDAMLRRFVGNVVYVALLTFVVLAAINQLGIQTTSFIAVIGAAGLAIGLALQGSLSNFASGMLIIIFRPYKVGDYIEAGGTAGTVEEVQIFTTVLRSPDNKTIIVPNAQIMGGTITNYSAKPQRRVDLVASVGYNDNLDKVKQVLIDILAKDERVLKDPAPTIAIMELADSSINFVVRPWVNASDYWPLYFDLNERIKKRFDEEGISIPFPQRDVHVYEHKSG
jgi:small conductance mechanosensitive channel